TWVRPGRLVRLTDQTGGPPVRKVRLVCSMDQPGSIRPIERPLVCSIDPTGVETSGSFELGPNQPYSRHHGTQLHGCQPAWYRPEAAVGQDPDPLGRRVAKHLSQPVRDQRRAFLKER